MLRTIHAKLHPYRWPITIGTGLLWLAFTLFLFAPELGITPLIVQ